MSIHLNKALGIACMSVLLQIGASSQNNAVPQASQDQKTDTPGITSINTNTDSTKSSAGDTAANSDKTDGVVSTGNKARKLIEPDIGHKNPEIGLNIDILEAKLEEHPFKEPSLDVLGEAHSFTATAYALKGITRAGTRVRRGVIAADPRVLPLGSVVQLKAGKYTGIYSVQDTGRLIKGNIVDVWVPSYKEAINFGRRKIKLHVLKVGESKIGRTKRGVKKRVKKK